ncbi:MULTISPECIES: carbohydrate ABC transporter permease [Paenibacillus]|jgi:sn-glycerol 3-phosphate transport system permease protein|uniref:Carbohydrate ABC transporter permease n=1 Tax=Paenibacillus baimaensis TaxID=2982185 RepID=A0ABT2U9G9_9BACL|nr:MULTISPECIES: carbohydrate ABC transporter permease [unclassified Paenibacillus]MCU6791279.1 carbohydrate ABC transporter permease [Paenibacillus sp. WQ 127069]OMF18989.1 ABC transporter permease [Paenibacillus sp. FSL H7-0331]
MLLKKLNISQWLLYIGAAFWLVPLLWMTVTAFRPRQIALSPSFSLEFTLDNFARVWSAAPFAQYYLNTILIVVGVFLVQMITASMAAFAFARVEFRAKNIVFLLFLIQIMVPADVLIFPNYSVLKELSLLDTKLGVMLPYFASAFGIFLLRQMFKTIPPELDEAAVMEGYSKWQILWKIYFPLSRPTYVAFGLVSVSYHWNNFLWPLIVTNSVENRPLTVGLAIFAQSFEIGAQWTEVSAATLLVIAPLMIGFLLFQRQFMNSFIHSGMK